MKPSIFSTKPMLCGAHRGGRFLWPENTVYAYENAAAKWPDILLEGDVQLTADKQVVVLHDDTVDRTTNGKGKISELTLEQVKALDAGYRFTTDGGKTFPFRGKGISVPLFSEVLACAPNSPFLIEMKNQPGLAEPTLAALREANAFERVAVASLNPELMRQARQTEPRLIACYDAPSGMLALAKLRAGEWKEYQPAAEMLAMPSEAVESLSVTPEEIRAFREKGICALVFTVNKPEMMRNCLNMGFSSILTDDPELLEKIIAERKIATR